MNETFRQHVEALHPAFERLVAATPFKFADLGGQLVPQKGIYLFSEDGQHLYIGRTDNIRRRLQDHCRQGSTHNQASFAFHLAREEQEVLKPTYKTEGSRQHLVSQDAFVKSFVAQKARLRAMDIRTVEEADANRQALLEMYASIALGTPYNDFNNH